MNERRAISQRFLAERSTDEDAYLAGFFDGEGAIVFTRPPGGRISVTVSNTCYAPLLRLKKAYGGSIYGPYRTKHPRWRPAWKWQLRTTREMHYALSKMYPWLTVKRYKAGWAIHALTFMPGRRGVTLSSRQRREVLQAHTHFHKERPRGPS